MPDLDWRTAWAIAVVVVAWITRSVWEPYLKGYSEEAGKRRATHEDIERVLAELRVITAETKSIEARIGGAEWDRQWVKAQKLGVYLEVLSGIDKLVDALGPLATALKAGDTKALHEQKHLHARMLDFLALTHRIRLFAPENIWRICVDVGSLARSAFEAVDASNINGPDEAAVKMIDLNLHLVELFRLDLIGTALEK